MLKYKYKIKNIQLLPHIRKKYKIGELITKENKTKYNT